MPRIKIESRLVGRYQFAVTNSSMIISSVVRGRGVLTRAAQSICSNAFDCRIATLQPVHPQNPISFKFLRGERWLGFVSGRPDRSSDVLADVLTHL